MRRSLCFLSLAVLAMACGEAALTPTEVVDQRQFDMSLTAAAAITVTPSPTGAKVDTDKEDYAPGETVTITGTGWAPGETVHLNLTEEPDVDGDHDWDVVADENGAFTDTSFMPGVQHLGVTFTLTATGPLSGTSVAVFTDGNVTAATTPAIFASNCATAQTSFTLGDEVCAETTISVQVPPAGDGDFRYQWVLAGAIVRQVTKAGGDNSTHQDTYTPLTAGSWTVRICNPTGNCATGALLSSATFTVAPVPTDDTPPVVTPNITGTLGNNGWYTSDVTVTWSVTDGQSAITSTTGCGPTTINTDTPGQTLTCTATSAGGTSSQSVTIKRDATAPTASAAPSPAPNGNGWNNTNVTVTFSGVDSGSGLASCDAPALLSSEGAGQSATGSCTDQAGNVSAPATASGINIDKTAPTATATPSPAANANGWNNTDVVVTFTGADNLSGIASCDADVTLSGEGAGQSATGSCTDLAGNVSAPATASGINIDKTNPVVAVTGVADGATYILGTVPVAGCSTTDALSGVASAASLSQSGGPVGSITATCSGASDNAGNDGSASATYSVVYAWMGFFQPVENLPAWNSAKAGQSIPVKFSLGGNQGLNIFAPGHPKVVTTTCPSSSVPVDVIDEYVTNTANNGLVYDALTGQYNYVWKTDKSWSGKCFRLDVKLIDGTTHSAQFKFTK